jgi:phage terminase large subunit
MSIKKLPPPRDFLEKQKQVLDAIKIYKYILYSGAFGAGKTLLMCHAAIQTCINNAGCFGMFGAQTVPMLRDTVVRTFLSEMDLYQQALDDNGIDIKLEKKWRPSIMSYRFFNNAEIVFRSCDKPSKFKSINFDFALLDEPVDIPDDIFLMLQGRIRADNIKKQNISWDDYKTMKKDPDVEPDLYSHRFIGMAGNPAGKMNWVYQFFFEHPPKNSFKVHTTTKDNTFLPRDYVKSMYDSYDFEYAQRYLEGQWGSFVGQVYKDFRYEKHVKDLSNKKDYNYFLSGVDVGFRNPTAMIAVGIDEKNCAYIVEEFYKNELTTDATVEVMKGWNKKYDFNRVYVDPSAADWIEKAKIAGIRVREGNNDIDKGIAKCKSLFANDFIYVDKNCKNFLKELESYQYDKANVRGNETEKPMKKNDHLMDSMRYCFTDFNPWHRKSMLSGGFW